MNRQRRKDLSAVIDSLKKIKNAGNTPSFEAFENLARLVQSSCDEEHDAFLNMPENLMFSDRYADMELNVYDLEDAVTDLESIAEELKKGGAFNPKTIDDIITSITKAIDR